ncbi:MAG: NCS2 family permease [Candidatus Aminicenantes bacterium]|nr:NCS2 family permease [Candidatus Aminicenantes bacterium]
MGFLDRSFRLKENKTNIRIELVGGLTTFMTMSYIIFVQPAILSSTGMDKGAVMFATCVSSALATLLMGLLAKYPIALAPAMGHNIFFAVIVCGTMGYSWQVALGAVFISGAIFIILSIIGVWESLVASVPDSLKHAIAVGIGLLIALIGLEYGGLVVDTPGVLVGLGDLTSRPVVLVLFGVILTAVLMAFKVPGAILIGILGTALLGIPLGVVKYHGLVSSPPSVLPTLFKLDILGAFQTGLFTVIFIFFFLDLFDTMGTLIGVSEPAGFIKKGRLPRANQAMFSDAIGTVGGALLGTSTVTSYIESATGIAQGARTGLANIFTSSLFIIALFFSPLAEMIGGEYIHNGLVLHPVVAPPLIIVGYLMMRCVTFIKWEDITEAIPAFLTIIVMPLTVSITEGIAFGFISYSLLKLVTGKGREVHWIIYLFSFLFIIRYLIK